MLTALGFAPGWARTNCLAESATKLGLPGYMDVIVGNQLPQSPAQSADQAILDLDLAMFGIYDDALAKYQANFFIPASSDNGFV